MKCPYCGNQDDKVIDSRTIKDGAAVRRRRQCLACNARFTSYETVEEIELRVEKKDGRREAFNRSKIIAGIQKACEKRPISSEQIEAVVDRIEEKLTREKKEVPTRDIGEAVIKELSDLDEVAYVRFASVYREFKDINEFMDELKGLLIDNQQHNSSEPPSKDKKPPKQKPE
ncbi:MAG: transcriptional regulator NrdR [bacterium]